MSESETAIVMAGPDGRITHWNVGAERLFGHSAAEALGRTLDLIVPPAFRQRHWSGFERAMRTHDCKLDGAATNLPVSCRDGSERLFPARFVFLRDARGSAVGAMGIYASPVGGEQPFGPIL